MHAKEYWRRTPSWARILVALALLALAGFVAFLIAFSIAFSHEC